MIQVATPPRRRSAPARSPPPPTALRPVNRLDTAPTPNNAAAIITATVIACCSGSPEHERRQWHDRTQCEGEDADRGAPRSAPDASGFRASSSRASASSAAASFLTSSRLTPARFFELHAARLVDQREFPRLLPPGARPCRPLSPIWYSNISRCERIDTYSPAAIDSAPASNPATPLVGTMSAAAAAPATPMIRLVFRQAVIDAEHTRCAGCPASRRPLCRAPMWHGGRHQVAGE